MADERMPKDRNRKERAKRTEQRPTEGDCLRLRIELIPKPLFGFNLRSREHGLGPDRWAKLRGDALKASGPRCAICSSTHRPHAHEVWEYQESELSGVAKLLSIEIICGDCHAIHHWGATKKLVEEGNLAPEALDDFIGHFMTVNGCDKAAFQNYSLRTFDQWRIRSAKTWTIDWGQFAEAVTMARLAREKWRAQQAQRESAASITHKPERNRS